MAEPNISATVYNTDVTYNTTPLDTGLKILALIDTPSGTYEIRNTTGKSDLIKHYLTTNEIKVENDDTVKQTAYLMDYSNIYTRRVGSISLKQGVSSLGELLLFDANNELLSKYYSLKINEWLDTLDYYYIAFGNTMWYTGDIAKLDEQTSQKYTKKIQVSESKSVDLLVQNLYKHLQQDEITILKTNSNTLLCRDELICSENLSFDIVENFNKYKLLSNVEGQKINIGEYIMLRDTIYYWQGDGSFQPTRYNNPVAIYSNGVIENSYDSGLFLLRVLKKVQETSNAYLQMPEIRGDGGLVAFYKGVQGTWEISSDCETKLKVKDGGNVLAIYDADDLITQGWIRLKFYKDAMATPGPEVTQVNSSYEDSSGVATLTSNNPISPEEDTTYKISISQVQNTYTFIDNIVSSIDREDTTGVVKFNIDTIDSNHTYEVTINRIVSDEQTAKEIIVTLNEVEITRQSIDFTDNATKNTVEISNLKFTSVGECKISLAGATFTGQSVKRNVDNKIRQLKILLGDEELQTKELDFSDGNTLSNIVIDEIEIFKEGKLKIELDKATFTGGKIERVYQKTLTEDEENGIDLKFQFVSGIATEAAPDGYIDMTLDENGLTPLGVITGILDELEVSSSEEFDVNMNDFSFSTQGVFTAYFEKRESIEKGTSAGNDIKSIELKSDVGNVTYQYDFLADAFMKGSKKNTDFYLRLGGESGTLFYVGKTIPPVQASYRKRLSQTPVTFAEFKELFLEALNSFYPEASSYQDEIAFPSKIDIEAQGVDFIIQNENQQTSAKFALIQNFTSDSDVFSMSYEKDTEITDYEVYNVTMGYKDNVTTYDVSFDEAAVDGYNRSLYYDRVQNEYLTFKILDGNAMLDSLGTYKWGKDIKAKKASVTDFIDAINKIPEKENIWFDFIWDAGKANSSIAIAIDKICNQKFALNMVSLPTEYNYNKNDKSGYQKVVEYAANLALDSRYSRIVWAKVRSGNVGNFSTAINGSTLALRNYISLYNSTGSEFCPQMGINYGKLEGTHLILPEQTVRNDLIDRFRIATVKGGDGVYAYHINDNTTTQSINTPYKEEQNVRTANAIVHIVDRIFYTYLGLKNDFITRNSLVEKCKEAITQRCVKNQIFSLSQVKIVCDESNNSDEDVANNILNLAVYARFGRAIKFGRLYVNSLPLDTGSTKTA